MDMKRIEITYFWNSNPGKTYDATAAIGEYDGESNDDDIFYWFAPGEEVIGDHGEFTVTAAEQACDCCGGSGFIRVQPTKENDMLRITEDKMIAVPTGSAVATDLLSALRDAVEVIESTGLDATPQRRAIDAATSSSAALTDGLAIAIEALEEFYGSDESETLDHLRNILATHGARKGS